MRKYLASAGGVDGDAPGRGRVVVVQVAVVIRHGVVVGDAAHGVVGRRARGARLLGVGISAALLQYLFFVLAKSYIGKSFC